MQPGTYFVPDYDMHSFFSLSYIKENSKNKKLRFRNIKRVYYRMLKKDKTEALIALNNLEERIKVETMISDDKAKALMEEHFVGKSLMHERHFLGLGKLEEYLIHNHCKKCKYVDYCDLVITSCPLIRSKYGDKVEEIKDFNPETFNPIKYYFGEPQGDTV